ncbi:MAG TPA: hypothetical protein VKB88_34835 [Bryobacteraceae bacterium]|nr:hypothetical protein [Bryobacteraceae bacterium]
MTPAASCGRPLQYFIHHDSDALRMEISGTLAGRAAEQAYDSWRRETLTAGREPLVIDISYVTGIDTRGQAVLRAWRGFGARIVTSSYMATPLPSLFLPPATGNPARAERARAGSAVANRNDAENAGFFLYSRTEQQLR